MEEDIDVIITELSLLEESYEENGYMSIGDFKTIDKAIKLIKEFKKIKIENIEYKMGQFPDTTEAYKNLKKELEKWKKT